MIYSNPCSPSPEELPHFYLPHNARTPTSNGDSVSSNRDIRKRQNTTEIWKINCPIHHQPTSIIGDKTLQIRNINAQTKRIILQKLNKIRRAISYLHDKGGRQSIRRCSKYQNSPDSADEYRHFKNKESTYPTIENITRNRIDISPIQEARNGELTSFF